MMENNVGKKKFQLLIYHLIHFVFGRYCGSIEEKAPRKRLYS